MKTQLTSVPAPAAVAAPPDHGLYGRDAECKSLDQLITDVRAGHGRAMILRGSPGAGKTALLDYLAARAADAGCRVTRSAGTQSEMEWAFAGLHQLCGPMLGGPGLGGPGLGEPMPGREGRLPPPQRDALRTALGRTERPKPDPLLLGLAVLGLLAEVAGDRPLICVVDDEQWLDRATAQALGFAARRLASVPVGLVFAARDPGAGLAGLPELVIGGLRNDDARALLMAALAGPLDARVRDLIVAETRGNPQALLELPRELTPMELAGGFGLPGPGPLAGRISSSFTCQLEALPAQTRRLVQLAAADLSGDPSLVWRAAQRLGIPLNAGIAAEEAGLVRFDAYVRFQHLSARSAVYWLASFAERRQLHAALAEVTDPVTDPDRRAWHRAQAATGPDEQVAAELERCVPAAQAQGGLAAAAAFLDRAVALTADPALYTARILAAAQASLRAGAFGKALELVAAAEARPLDEFASARVELLHGQIALASGSGSDAPGLLLKAAKRLEQLDAELAREAYLNAWLAALSAGRLAAGGDLPEVYRAVRGLASPTPTPSPTGPRTTDLVLEGLALMVTDGPAAAAPALRQAVSASAFADLTAEEAFRWGWLAPAAASMVWDNATWRVLLARQAEHARAAGALDQLPVMLDALGTAVAASGDFTAASALAVEAGAIRAVTGARAAPVTAMMLASLRGRDAEAAKLIDSTIAEAEACGQGIAVAHARWATAILCNGLGRYEEALTAAGQAVDDSTALPISMWALPELIEAATRTGHDKLARDAQLRLAEITRACGSDWALGVEARCRALLGDVDDVNDVDACYREAIDRLGRVDLRPELARSHLLYGEWLRREGRRAEAREQLRTAHETLTALGLEGFAERARRELLATGAAVREHKVETVTALTAQEALIARLACDGRSNPEIGSQLFLSARTVEYHLRKVYTKLGISSRRHLHAALAKHPQPAQTPKTPQTPQTPQTLQPAQTPKTLQPAQPSLRSRAPARLTQRPAA